MAELLSPHILSVTQAVDVVNQTLREHLGEVLIEGEVSGFGIRQGRWVTFSLKDDSSRLECFMVKEQLRVPLEDGMLVRVLATTRVYPRFGKFSLNPLAIELVGEGALRRAYELLLRQLEAEGLFAEGRKRPLPRFPSTIALVTSKDGAALHDVRRVLTERWGGFTLQLYPVAVQGQEAIPSVLRALQKINTHSQADVLILTRGGGSLEDLQAFNSEEVARAIASSRVPTIVAIGHESDTSIAELVADRRAATPSNAAQLAVPDRQTVGLELADTDRRIDTAIRNRFERARSTIDRLVRAAQTMRGVLNRSLERAVEHMSYWRRRQPNRLRLLSDSVVRSQQLAVRLLNDRISTSVRSLRQMYARVTQLGPQQVLARGYSFTRRADSGTILRSSQDIQVGTRLVTQLADGQLSSEVTNGKK